MSKHRWLFQVAALVLVGLSVSLIGLPPSPAAGQAGSTPDVPGQVPAGVALPPKPARAKLDGRLNDFVERVKTTTPSSVARAAPFSVDSQVAVTIATTDTATTKAFVLATGGVTANVLSGVIEAYVPVAALDALSQRGDVLRVSLITRPEPDVTTQGAAVHNSPNWNAGGYTGAGVKVGVIDVGFVGFSTLMGTELPGAVVARCYTAVGVFSSTLANCQTSSVHGTAVSETIMDVAPAASLYIANPYSTGDLLAAAQWMATQGVQVINYSVGWTWSDAGAGTSIYPTSPLAAVDSAVANNIVWVNSAGNSNQKTWTAAFSDTDSDGWMQVSGSNENNQVVLSAGESITVQLRWEDSWGLAATDLDLYLLKGAAVVASSQDVQAAVAGQVPYEILSYTASSAGTYSISVKRYSAPAYSGRVQVQRFGNGADLQFWNPEGSVGSPADSASAGMLTVGAANWQTTSTIEPFSSQGPTTDNRVKPDLVGADCANTVTYGTNGFCGTSQASPHVTGLAALVRQRFPTYTAAQVVSYLKTNASGRGTVPNNAWGTGLAFASTIALPATKVAFTGQPASASVGSPLSPLTVQIQDAMSTLVASDNSTVVTVSKLSGPGSLTCSPVTAIAGVATFSNCTVSATGSYVLHAASSPVLTPADTSSFTVSPPAATKLAFSAQPAAGTVGVALTPLVVQVQDGSSAVVTGDNSTIVTLTKSSGAGTLTCLPATAIAGVATFSGCTVSAAGSYTLLATSSPVLTPTTSSAFAVAAAPATKLGFSQQPPSGTAGQTLPTQPVVTVQDSTSATVTTDNSTVVTLSLLSGPGTLSCTGGLTKTTLSGVATFSGCSVSAAGLAYVLHATSSPALTAADSSAFVITGPATQLAFTQQPSPSTTGAPLATQPKVAVKDALGTTVTADNVTSVTLTLQGGVGVLSCTGGNARTAVAGVATFSGCSVSVAGSYTLLASSSPILTPATSSAFAISSPVAVATKLGFTQQPSSGTAGQTLPTQPVVTVQDATSATVTTDNSTVVTLSLLSGPGTLSCADGLSKTAISGVATFSGCAASAAGSYQIRATSNPTLTPADGLAFVVAAPVGLAGTIWYFAEGFTGLGWTTELHLLNANASAATVAVTYLLDSGTPVTRNVSIPAQRELTLDASNLTVGPGPNVAFGVRITSDIPIVAEEQMYAGASGDFAHGTQGATALSNTWYFAEGFTQFGWQTFVLVANPGASAVNVTVTYQVQGGSPVTKLVTVAAGTRQTFLGHVDVPDQAFSVSVSATGPVVAEMAMYDPGRTIAHRTVGVTAPASAWYLGEGFTGFGWETFIAVGNPGATDATVTATFTIDGGAPVVRVITVPAHSRGTFIAHDPTAGVGTGKAFGVFITSTSPVVVQEVLIDPVAGASRANSTMAASALASQWSFSGGSSNPGIITFLTVSNPGLSSASVTATYYFNDGTPPATQLLTIPAQSRGTFASSSGIPANKTFGIVLTATGSLVVAQEAVYDESLHRAFSAAGAAGP